MGFLRLIASRLENCDITTHTYTYCSGVHYNYGDVVFIQFAYHVYEYREVE